MEETFFFFLLHLNPKTAWVCKVSFEVISMRKKWLSRRERPLLAGKRNGGMWRKFLHPSETVKQFSSKQ